MSLISQQDRQMVIEALDYYVQKLKDKIIAQKLQSQHSKHSLTGLNWSISKMKINLWYCADMKQWRWTLTDNTRPVCKQESGRDHTFVML
jgi:hypothetical protein